MNNIKTVSLSQVAKIIPGVLPQEKKGVELFSFSAIGPWQLSSFEISNDYGVLLRDIPCADEQYLLPDDVLIKRLNPNGACIFNGIKDKIVASANLFVIRPNKELDARYLAFFLENSDFFSSVTHISGAKSTTVAAITAQKLGSGRIYVPCIEEQKKIGELWSLAKQREKLLQLYIAENRRMLDSIIGKIKTST